MNNKLKELTEKLYKEGIKEGEEKANEITKTAEDKATEIIEKAKKEKEKILNEAKKEAEKIKITVMHDLDLAGKKAINEVKENIVNLLLNLSLKQEKTKKDFMNETTVEILNSWLKEKDTSLTLEFPKEKQKDLENFIKASFKAHLDKSLEVEFSEDLDSGFIIKPKNASYKIEFSDESFISFYKEHLKPFTKNLLFKG
jgi:V/A-type H+/Na+-transporting ATPase subunit E